MKFNLKSIAIHIFLIVTSLAAFPHSTVAFATGFGGLEPMPQFALGWWAWALEGMALAFALDIGLLEIARKIRNGNRSPWMLAAFIVLALFQFYLQFSFIAVHSPHQAVADGVRAEWVGAVSWMLDAKIWLYPALLPVALILFSFADSGEKTDEPKPSTVVEHGDGLTTNQIAVEKWMTENDIHSSVDELEAAESAGVAIAALPLDRRNGHGPK